MAGDRLERNFGKLHALHVSAFTRHLIECRRACDGDLDLFLVLTIIGERTFSPRFAPDAMSHTEFLEGTVESVEPLAITSSRLPTTAASRARPYAARLSS